MSWWLSEAVQADLDAQFCDMGNRSGLNDLMQRITRPAELISARTAGPV